MNLNDYLKMLVTYLKHQKYSVLLLGLIMGLGLGIKLLSPQVTSYFIDAVSVNKSNSVLSLIALVFVATAVTGQLLGIWERYVSENIGWVATNSLKMDLVKHCLSLDMEFHKTHQPGELIERIDGDVNVLFEFFSRFLISLLSSILLIMGILSLLFREDYRIGLSISGFVILSLVTLFIVHARIKDHWGADRELNAEFYGFLEEHISGTEDISSSGAKNYVMNTFTGLLKKMLPVRARAVKSGIHIWTTTFITYTLGNIIAFGVSGYFLHQGIISLGTVYLIISYTNILNGPLHDIRAQVQTLQQAKASMIRIKELLHIQPELKDGSRNLVHDGAVAVTLNHVSFHYQSEPLVLQDLSFHLPKGKVMGVIGRTGSGKTSLARLLARFYDVSEGEIWFDDTDVRSLTSASMRKEVAFVTQDIQLFHASIRNNLTLFHDEIDDKTIIDTMADLGLKDWYEALPQGLDTRIKPDETGLSGGEAQLLAFVRVFLKNPVLLILDEATSRLDPVTEQLVERALDKLIKGRTCIIIAHRLATLQRTDYLLMLDNGRAVEFGKREELEQQHDSLYSELLQMGTLEVMV